MITEIRFFWARLNANYWFYPALFSIIGAALAFGMVWLDRNGLAETLSNSGWLVPARPEGAMNMLSVMAGSMIGVAATVFSITIAAVAYASGNYGPRLLTNFMEDRGNQLSLATFIGSFVYAAILLSSIRGEDETAPSAAAATVTNLPGFVPQASVLVAYILMALCVGVLVFFLNHIPSSIRINMVLEGIGKRLLDMICDTYPVENEFSDAREPEGGDPVLCEGTGYVQMIDFEQLEELAKDKGCILSLRVRTGDFVQRELALLDVKDAKPDDVGEAVRAAITLDPVRTPEQDPQFLIDELVEIGLRALSPGINDPFTAITAMHWLGAATSEIARRDLRKNISNEDADTCPVIPRPDDFAHFIDRGFNNMRSAVSASPIAARIMLDALANAVQLISDNKRRDLLRDQGRLLIEQTRGKLAGPDLELVEYRYHEFERAFEG